MICPYCQTEVKESEAILCPLCGMPYHSECWTENGGCAVYGCTGRAQRELPPLVVNFTPPAHASLRDRELAERQRWVEWNSELAQRRQELFERQGAVERMHTGQPPMAFFYTVTVLCSLWFLWDLFQFVCNTNLAFNTEWRREAIFSGVLAIVSVAMGWVGSIDAWPPRKTSDNMVFLGLLLLGIVMLIAIAAKGGLLQ